MQSLTSNLAAIGQFTSPRVEWFPLVPDLILVGGALVLLVATAIVRKRPFTGFYSLFTVATGLAGLIVSAFLWHDVDNHGPRATLGGAISVDEFSVFFFILICATVVVAALLLDDYLRRERLDGSEVYALMLLSATGGMVMASANDLVVLFLGLETLSIALYVMAASHLRRIESQESAMKYFILGSVASAFFLYGVAMVYGATGTTNLSTMNSFLASNILDHPQLLFAGFAFLLVGLGFKVAAAPFHFWTPDVYQGAPTPVSGFMASAAKTAAFAAMLRVFVVTFSSYRDDWRPIVWALAVITMIVGSVVAVVQTDVKRLLAYSSIAHAGYILVGVQAGTADGTSSALFYLLAYTFMTLGSFGVVTLVSRIGDGHTALDDFRGLSKRRPVLAFTFTVFLLAQAGVPLTSGFLAKFRVIGAAASAHSYALAIIAMLSTVIGAFLYLKVVVAMYLTGDETYDRDRVPVPPGAFVALTVALAITLVLGFFPSFVIDLSRHAVTG